MAYQIRLNNFEGPFDLLFHLIEKAEVDIYDIPIAEITNQYLDYISEIDNLDLETASEFIVMAATLIQIKSKMLLPKEVNPLDEIAVGLADPRDELIERLLEYKKYKEASNILKENEEKYINIFCKNAEVIDDIGEENLFLSITLDDIVNAFNDIIRRCSDTQDKNETLEKQIMRDEFTVNDKIQNIKILMKQNHTINFHTLFENSVNKLEIVITFLALLELIRLREVKVYQTRTYGDIVIEAI